jgi:hypothetical protein
VKIKIVHRFKYRRKMGLGYSKNWECIAIDAVFDEEIENQAVS